jgi:hypothetical protein
MQGGITHPVKLKSEVIMVQKISRKEIDSKVKQGNQKDINPPNSNMGKGSIDERRDGNNSWDEVVRTLISLI